MASAKERGSEQRLARRASDYAKQVRREDINPATFAVDLIADALHYAEAHGADVDDVVRVARAHHEAERAAV